MNIASMLDSHSKFVLLDCLLPKEPISTLHNYGVLGLHSHLLLDLGERGKVRMFEMTRHQERGITPHSHRFDFTAFVLQGEVCNISWEPTEDENADLFLESTIVYKNRPGCYEEQVKTTKSRWVRSVDVYKAGDVYRMASDQVHSIWFDKGTKVLFMEHKTETDRSVILRPVDDLSGCVLDTFVVEPWMFMKELPKI